ncbi:hypothetical protein [Phenylobacterium montanum]|uniref:High potential iron-sulfur proteins family profile domain-containing protein n=1 Tax=Phenylobacterium montanum TaxID=2823693 RepID=A0A975G3F3_9CAUL|nr:hypothetical protein [Caulobacter sp. S6]QUD89829.1 hypothetical protein KCG34_08150 [Caulobacter sp. S6]
MPADDPRHFDRRHILRRGGVLFAFGAALTTASHATAASKVSKEFVKYQYSPKDGLSCGVCASFVLPDGGTNGATGTCKIVEGPIPQTGWCEFFSKPRRPAP